MTRDVDLGVIVIQRVVTATKIYVSLDHPSISAPAIFCVAGDGAKLYCARAGANDYQDELTAGCKVSARARVHRESLAAGCRS